MSRILNRGSVIWWFECCNAIVIYDGIIFDFYTGLPHIHTYAVDICIYITCDVKGKHDLIIRGWTNSGAHTHSNTTVFTVFFLVDMALISTVSQGSCNVDGTPAETYPPLPIFASTKPIFKTNLRITFSKSQTTPKYITDG